MKITQRHISALALSTALFTAMPAVADQPAYCAAIASSQAAAEKLFVMVDKSQFEQAWLAGSQALQKQVKQEDWQRNLDGGRSALGSVSSRKLRSLTYSTSFPGMPDGEYVLFHYETSFANKSNTTETAVMQKEADGQWRHSGYLIK